MLRQRLRGQTSPFSFLGQFLVAVLGAGLVYYGLMLVLLGLKTSPETVNRISRYRTVYDYFAGLEPPDITDRVRWIAGLAGFATFLVCSYLAWKQLPRPYLARGSLDLYEDELTTVTVEPRAVERAAEGAALEHPAVSGAAARYGVNEGLTLDVSVRQARGVPETIREVHTRAVESLERHGLPAIPVSVTLTGFDRKQRRELD